MSIEAVGTIPLLKRVQEDVRRAEVAVAQLRKAHQRLVISGLLATAFATTLAGLAAAGGPPIGEGPPAWRVTCGSIAVLTAIAGVLTGVNERFDYGGRLAGARTYVARLRALELALSVGGKSETEALRQYEEILSQHPEQ